MDLWPAPDKYEILSAVPEKEDGPEGIDGVKNTENKVIKNVGFFELSDPAPVESESLNHTLSNVLTMCQLQIGLRQCSLIIMLMPVV